MMRDGCVVTINLDYDELRKQQIRLRTYDEDYHQSYVELADHPHELATGLVHKTIRIQNLIDDYDGLGIAIDFDKDGRAIGIEILYRYEDEDLDD